MTAANEIEKDPAAQPDNQTDVQPPEKKKKWGRILLWIIGILAGILVLLIIFRDPIIRITTCKVGSFLTGTEVKLADFSTSLSGKVRLKGFSVGNPKGYTKNNAIEFKEIYISISPASLLTDMIRIDQITVTGMNVNFESNFTESNLGTIQDNINAIAGSSKKESPEEQEEDGGEDDQDAKKVLIVKLDASDNFVSFSSSTLSQTVSVPLPPAHLSDIGGKPLSETVGELFSILISSVGNAASGVGGAVSSAFSQTGAVVTEGISQTGAAVTKGAQDLGKGIGKESSKLFNSIKNTFK